MSRGCHLCGGNDETPPEHTLDCAVAIDRAQGIELAARAYLKRHRFSERQRLEKALAVTLLCEPTRCQSVHNGMQCAEALGHGYIHVAFNDGADGNTRAITWSTPMARIPKAKK